MTIDDTAQRPPAVALRAVDVTYHSGPPWARRSTRAVAGVDLEIAAGEIVGLVGESGSGKTTIGRLVLGLLVPDRGEVVLDGAQRPRRRLAGDVQLVLQHPEWALNPYLRIGTSIREPLDVRRRGSRAQRRARLNEILELVGLEASMARRFPHELSGGQRQRAAIARALITDPRLVVFDEAVSALDVSAQTQVLNLIRETQQHQRYAALFVSHDIAAVRYVADRIVVVYHGSVVADAPARAFYGHLRHPYAAALVEGDVQPVIIAALEGPVPTDGCALSPRCPFATDRCHRERPLLRRVADQFSACHHAEEI